MGSEEVRPRKDYKDYKVGWICALSKERTAAVGMLDVRHQSLPSPPDDSNAYELGSIGGHNIVIACLPKGRYGNTPATTVAVNLMRTFPDIRFGLMVGIGGGIPPKVRLGDVVVSVPKDAFPGVVQWDMGKTEKGNKFKRTGSLNKPPPLLLSAITNMETEQELHGSQIPEILAQFAKRFPSSASKWLRSNTLEDVLFKASYDHVDSEIDESEDEYIEDDEENCRRCDRTQTVKRKPRDMKVHYGLIASGNQVIKDAQHRKALAKELGGNVLCIDMEAAGLMDNFPCIVIRGICDYADSHKNKAWQKHAAAVAAALAKELLGCVMPNDIAARQSAKDILDSISQTVATVQKDTTETRKFIENQQSSQLLDWLSTDRYYTQQSDNMKQWQRGTCTWFLDSSEYQGWLKGKKKTLYCPGIPGAGKTIMSCAAIHNISERVAVRGDVGLAYVYFAFSRQQEQTVEHVLGSLLAQLLQGMRCFPPNLYELKAKGNRPTPEHLFDELCLAASGYEQVFIVLDALDECSIKEKCRSTVLDCIANVQSKTGVNLLATSRIHQDIASRFEGLHVTSIPISARDDDVGLFLATQLETFNPEIFDEEFRKEVASKIIEITTGMFLLAKLHLNTLLGSPTKGEVKEYLNNLSSGQEGLEKVYDLAMERIRQQGSRYSELAHRLLMWIVHARRPLFTLEIQHALAIRPGTSKVDTDFIPSVMILKSICAGLVTLDQDSDIIRLVHYTAQEYFVKSRKFERANVRITEACVTYLSFPCFDGWTDTTEEYEQRLRMHPFYYYASSKWIYHARVCFDQSAAIEFLKKDAHVEASNQTRARPGNRQYRYFGWKMPKNFTGLHLAVSFGLLIAAETLVSVLDVNARDSSGCTPLLYAIGRGDIRFVKLLLSSGQVDVNLGWEHETSPLHLAMMGKKVEILKLLLETGKADTCLRNRDGCTLMQAALEQNNLETIRMVLEKHKLDSRSSSSCMKIHRYWDAFEDIGVIETIIEMDMLDLEKRDADGNTPLWMAVSKGNLRMVELSLNNNGVDPDVPGEYGWTPLGAAVRERHHEMIELLLKTGKVNINAGIDEFEGSSPIREAMKYDKVLTMKLLNGAPATTNPRYGPIRSHWWTGLGSAVHREWWEVVELLFEKNQVDLEQVDDDGYTTLSWAANEGKTDVVKLILDKKPMEAMVKDRFGDMPVYLAALSGHEDVVSILLEAMGVNKDSADWKTYIEVAKGANAVILRTHSMAAKCYQFTTTYTVDDYVREIILHAFAGEGSTALVEFYLKSTRFDINAIDKDGKTPLHWAAKNGCTEVVELLLSTKKADPTIRDFENDWKPLHWAIENDHAGVVKLLLPAFSLEHSNVEDRHGEMPMILAAQAGSMKVVEMLLKTDTKILDVKDKIHGRTALHVAAAYGHTEVFSLLLSKTKSGDVDVRTRNGKTALHLAAEYNRSDIVKLLLETGQADMKAKDRHIGLTPLKWAMYGPSVGFETVKLLHAEMVKKGYNVEKIKWLDSPYPEATIGVWRKRKAVFGDEGGLYGRKIRR